MAYFDRFDICEAYYQYAVDYHAGGEALHPRSKRPIFARLDKLGFEITPLWRGFESLEDDERSNALEIYRDLEAASAVKGEVSFDGAYCGFRQKPPARGLG